MCTEHQVKTGENWLVEVTNHHRLDVDRYVSFVSDPAAGAISTFSGVTRNSFQGKKVIRLEYEAYVPMAVKKLEVSRFLPISMQASHDAMTFKHAQQVLINPVHAAFQISNVNLKMHVFLFVYNISHQILIGWL